MGLELDGFAAISKVPWARESSGRYAEQYAVMRGDVGWLSGRAALFEIRRGSAYDQSLFADFAADQC